AVTAGAADVRTGTANMRGLLRGAATWSPGGGPGRGCRADGLPATELALQGPEGVIHASRRHRSSAERTCDSRAFPGPGAARRAPARGPAPSRQVQRTSEQVQRTWEASFEGG